MQKVFNAKEEKILKIIGKKKIRITEITKQFYGRNVPENGAIMIASSVRQIANKAKWKRLDWRIQGEGLGRRGRTVWKEQTH